MAAPFQLRFQLLLVLTLCLSSAARAQSASGSVIISGSVSGTVALSLAGGSQASDESVRISSTHNPDESLTVTLSGASHRLTEIRIPVQIRSNTAYRLFVKATSRGSNLSSLSIVEAHATGNLVTADAVTALSVAGLCDGRQGSGKSVYGDEFNHPNLSFPLELLSGPRVSLGGTLASAQNGLEVALAVAVRPQANGQDWTIELLLSPAPY